MARARFEIECCRPEIVKGSLGEEDEHPLAFTVEPGMLIIEVEAATVRELMKVSYSVCNRVQLAIDTVEQFK